MEKKQVVFANNKIIVVCEYTDKSCGYDRFSLSFDCYEINRAESEQDEIQEYVESYIDNCDTDYKWDICECHDLRPSELTRYLANEYCGIDDLYNSDTLGYAQTASDDSVYWFRFYSAGQHNYTKDYSVYGIEPSALQKLLDEKLINFWNKYHLKTDITEEQRNELKEIMAGFKEIYPLDPWETAEKIMGEVIANYEETGEIYPVETVSVY